MFLIANVSVIANVSEQLDNAAGENMSMKSIPSYPAFNFVKLGFIGVYLFSYF